MSKSKWFNNAGSLWGRIGDSFFKIYNANKNDRITGMLHVTDDIDESEIEGNEATTKQENAIVKGINDILAHEADDSQRIVFSLSKSNLEKILENCTEYVEFSVSRNIERTLTSQELIASKDDIIIIRYDDDYEYSLVACIKSSHSIVF